MSFMKSAWSDSMLTQLNKTFDTVKSMSEDMKVIQAKQENMAI